MGGGASCAPSQDPLSDPGLCPSTSPSGGRRSLTLSIPKAHVHSPAWSSLHKQPGSQTGVNKQRAIFMIEIALWNNVRKPRGGAGEKAPRKNKTKTTDSL